jgi:hypothetical protein
MDAYQFMSQNPGTIIFAMVAVVALVAVICHYFCTALHGWEPPGEHCHACAELEARDE